MQPRDARTVRADPQRRVRDAVAYRIAERVKERVEASVDPTDKLAFLVFRDKCIAEENQARTEIASIATALLSPPDVFPMVPLRQSIN